MSIHGTVSSKGQITIPQEIRKRLGVRPGDRVEFGEHEGWTVLKPVRESKGSFAKWAGIAPAFKTEKASIDWVRSLRDDDADEPGK